MGPRHVLVVSVQGHGHVYPSLGLVTELVKRGHRVSYVTTPIFTEVVEATGATVLHYRSVFDDVRVPEVVTQDDAESQIHLIYLKENEAILRATEAALDADPPDLRGVDVTGALFVGCRFASPEVEMDLLRRHAIVVPPFERRPYPTHPALLYTPEDLSRGFAEAGFAGMFDTRVYDHFRQHGGATQPDDPPPRERRGHGDILPV